MRIIGITARVDLHLDYAEKRDGLDQRWWAFLTAAGLTPVLLPNFLPLTQSLVFHLKPQGFVLSGGNNLLTHHGNTPERDEVETWLLGYAQTHNMPLIGVCRGMQALLEYYHIPQYPVQNQIQAQQKIIFQGQDIEVNSYHTWGTQEINPPLEALGWSHDGIIKACRHQIQPQLGLMWHPERLKPFRQEDLQLFSDWFK